MSTHYCFESPFRRNTATVARMDIGDITPAFVTAVLKTVSSILSSISVLFRRGPRDLKTSSERDRRKTRSERDRRVPSERRTSPIDQRMREGMWLKFHKATRAGEFDSLTLDAYRKTKVHDALWPVAT